MRNSLTEAISYTTNTVSKRRLSPKETPPERTSICCVYNYKTIWFRNCLKRYEKKGVTTLNNLEAIDLRQSRRAYLPQPMDTAQLTKLQTEIDQCNKESGLSIQLVEDGREAFSGFNLSYGMFQGVRSYIALIGKTSDEHLKEKAGYYGEKLVLEATKLGLGTCWVGGTFNRSNCASTIHADETLVLIITIGMVPAKKPFRENAIYKLAHRKTKSLEQLYSSDTTTPDWLLGGMKCVQKAPSAVNLQPVQFRFEKGSLLAEVKNANSYQLIDLGIAKLHFELGAGNGRFELGNRGIYILYQS